eukprot:Partr_v1_DN28988_c0_g1_i6_m24856 putative eukaryotic translation initiation factor
MTAIEDELTVAAAHNAAASDFDQVTVSLSAPHPLNSKWTLWFDNPRRKTNDDNWSANLQKIITVDSIEDFWGVFNNTVPASLLPFGANYHLFRIGVKPEWEDPANIGGGRLTLNIDARNKELFEKLWIHTVRSKHCRDIC